MAWHAQTPSATLVQLPKNHPSLKTPLAMLQTWDATPRQSSSQGHSKNGHTTPSH
ncbi:uncharacterized protein DS421_1g14630 [Arachis hypogaea]|nr:uncharacterized protein DS421_1g14630 [Arachis hypogaea]